MLLYFYILFRKRTFDFLVREVKFDLTETAEAVLVNLGLLS